MAEEKMVVVRNRNVGGTGYTLENGFHRQFEYNEVKKVPLTELIQLSYAGGGEKILRDYLVIDDKSALDALNLEVEPEYFYSDVEIKKILLEGTLDQLEDTLNFAPGGVIEIIKKMAVDLEIPDTRKRDMITKATGFNINNAINVRHMLAEDQPQEEDKETPKRKTTPLKVGETSLERKAAVPANKYNVVKKG